MRISQAMKPQDAKNKVLKHSLCFSLQKISVCSDDISMIMTSFIEDLSQLNVKQGNTRQTVLCGVEISRQFLTQQHLMRSKNIFSKYFRNN